MPNELSDHYLNLAVICLGEALIELGNVRQRRGVTGSDYANVQFCIRRASFALHGTPYEAPELDPKHGSTDLRSYAQRTGKPE
jgi:hypothetical protein